MVNVCDEKLGIIKNTFGDDRLLECCDVCVDGVDSGSVFVSGDDELVYFEFQVVDFTYDELVRYTGIAERLFEVYGEPVSVYVLCGSDVKVLVKEMNIKSFADFVIKLGVVDVSPCHVVLDGFKRRVDGGGVLCDEELEFLFSLPLLCDESEKDFFRVECFKLLDKFL